MPRVKRKKTENNEKAIEAQPPKEQAPLWNRRFIAERQRKVQQLYMVHHLSMTQVSEHMGISLGTVHHDLEEIEGRCQKGRPDGMEKVWWAQNFAYYETIVEMAINSYKSARPGTKESAVLGVTAGQAVQNFERFTLGTGGPAPAKGPRTIDISNEQRQLTTGTSGLPDFLGDREIEAAASAIEDNRRRREAGGRGLGHGLQEAEASAEKE